MSFVVGKFEINARLLVVRDSVYTFFFVSLIRRLKNATLNKMEKTLINFRFRITYSEFNTKTADEFPIII